MKEALVDVTPANDEICLMMPQQNGGKSNKKKKLNASNKFKKGRTHVASISDEQKVCSKALECLGFLLVYHGVLMKPVLFFVMQEKITSIGFMIAAKTLQDGDLYRDPACRSRLLDLVGFLMTHPVNKMPVPISYGLALLTKIKNYDPDRNVRDVASVNLNRAETTIHNRKEVFYFPTDYRDLRDTLLFNKQTIQKFNEAIIAKEYSNVKQRVTNEIQEVADEVMYESVEEPKEFEAADEVMEETKEIENVVISDSESDKAEVVKNGKSLSENLKNDLIDGTEETQEISDDEVEIIQPKPSPEKRQLRSTSDKISAKKPKLSDKKDDDLIEEYLADFSG